MKDLTELIFILDRSGSMGGLESDTIGGFNSMLAKQQKEEGECRLTTVLFDNDYEILHDRIDIKAVGPITEQEYNVRGTTALLDAIGRTINKIAAVQRNTAEEYRADKVLFIITTDGMENASREFDYGDIKALIEKQKNEAEWEFIFLGANIDAIEVANSFGITRDHAQSYHNDSEGISMKYGVLSRAVSNYRQSREKKLDNNWYKDLYEDYIRRKK